MVAVTISDELFLPWVESANDRRFKQILRVFLTIFVLIGVIVPFLPVAEIVQKDLKTVAPRLSKIIMEQKKQPPPPPPQLEAKKKIKKKPVKKAKKIDKKSAAFKKASSSGLVALSSELADLRDSFNFVELDSQPLKKSKGQQQQTFHKDLITARASSASSGINTEKLSRSTSGSKLSGRTTTKVTSDTVDTIVKSQRASLAGKKALRNEREIEQVFQKNKGAIYSIYNRALRKDPMLAGKVVIELTIGPDGRVIECHIISSDLGSPALERKIVARIKLFRFKPGNSQTTTIKYPIDFLPS